MEEDFHYDLIYFIAAITKQGYPDIVAYASQFVDDNNEGLFSINGKRATFPERIRVNGGYYRPIMTQSLSLISLDSYVQRCVYVPFHFLPGDNDILLPGDNEEGKWNAFSVTPNSNNAQVLLKEALKSSSPHRIGIALHTYVDTWSHQNFSGFNEEWNMLYPWYRPRSMVPNIGHAEAGHTPDIISESWTDSRFKKKINNRERTLDAAKAVYIALRKHSGKGPTWSEMKSQFGTIIRAEDFDQRRKVISGLLGEHGISDAPRYVENKWMDKALNMRDGEIVVTPYFKDADWYYFQQAAKEHFACVMRLIKNL